MNTEQFSTLNMWMAILAIAAVVQLLAMATLAIVGLRLYSKVSQTLADLDRKHIEPLKQSVNKVLDNVNAEVARVRHVGDKVERTAEAVTGGISSAASSVRDAMLPGYAVTRGVWAAISAFRKGGKDAHQQQLARRANDFDSTFDTTHVTNERGQ